MIARILLILFGFVVLAFCAGSIFAIIAAVIATFGWFSFLILAGVVVLGTLLWLATIIALGLNWPG